MLSFVTDLFEDFLYISPNAAAKNLLIEVNTKRKGILEPTIQFIMEILTANPPDPMKKDGALHMLGALAKKLSKVDFSVFLKNRSSIFSIERFIRSQSQSIYRRQF